jgi:hypothetical protein
LTLIYLDVGGVYVIEWTTKSVKIWTFAHNQLPTDIKDGQPDPSLWDTPLANFHGDCNFGEGFRDQIVTTTKHSTNIHVLDSTWHHILWFLVWLRLAKAV